MIQSDTAPAGPVGMSATATWAHRPLPGRGARLTGGLLHDWQRRNLAESLPLALRQLEAAGNLDNVRLAIQAGLPADGADGAARSRRPLPRPGVQRLRHPQGPRGARLGPRPVAITRTRRLRRGTAGLLARVQRPDGYLNSYIQASGEPWYRMLASSHEMYCAGHLIQAAIAWPGARASRPMDVATRLADTWSRSSRGQRNGLDGHPIIETALVELYRETGTAAYRDLAKQFVDQRGHGLAGDSGYGRRYLQDHLRSGSGPPRSATPCARSTWRRAWRTWPPRPTRTSCSTCSRRAGTT